MVIILIPIINQNAPLVRYPPKAALIVYRHLPLYILKCFTGILKYNWYKRINLTSYVD